jgi:hypothetical protein
MVNEYNEIMESINQVNMIEKIVNNNWLIWNQDNVSKWRDKSVSVN